MHPGKFDLILTNPPFGAVIRRTEKGDGYLEQFQLMRYLVKDYPLHTDMIGEGEETDTRLAPKSVKPRASVKTEIVFLERIHSFLKPGTGRAAVVLPDGVLTNSSLQGVRHWLMNHFQLMGVVSLPPTAFSHYDAGVKASIVFLRRLRENETPSDDEAIFMALAENIGYDATGRKTFNVTLEQEEAGGQKVERHSCDLFDYRVYYDATEGGSWRIPLERAPPGNHPKYRTCRTVGGVSEGPNTFFRVGPAQLAKPKCFAVKRGEYSTRIDVNDHATFSGPELCLWYSTIGRFTSSRT